MLHVNIYFPRMLMRYIISTALSDVERSAADVCIEMWWPICVGIATGSCVSLSMMLPVQLTHSHPLLSVCFSSSLELLFRAVIMAFRFHLAIVLLQQTCYNLDESVCGVFILFKCNESILLP